jgi:hypothetical protein
VYDRIDGVIHGAGVIEDKLLEDKLPDSFDRVFETKVSGAFTLSRALRPNSSLKFLIFFSSVAGRLGNRGQSDYAAANEVLNKLAAYLDRQWSGRVVSINWGPWANAGMVSPEVQRQFAARGVQMIDPQSGQRALDGELRYGKKGEVEVILAGGAWENMDSPRSKTSLDAFPLLTGVPFSVGNGGVVEAIYRLDPSAALYLQDHRLDGKPVFPAAMAMELMVEVVQKGWPEWKVAAVRGFRVLKGIILEDGPKSTRVVARAHTQPSEERLGLEVNIEISELKGPGHVCYRATVLLAERLPTPVPHEIAPQIGMRAFPMTMDEVYSSWLFHGPRFQCISAIEGIDEHGIIASVLSSSPQHCLASSTAGQWLIDPIVIDSGAQLAILWARAYKDMTALPSSFCCYQRFGSLSGAAFRCHFRVLPSSADHTLLANVFFVGSDGRLLGLLEGLESTCSKSLNRLVGLQTGKRGGGL